jgi:hypothetical protein
MKMGIVAYFKALKGIFRINYEKGMARGRLNRQVKDDEILPTHTFSFNLKDEMITTQVIIWDDYLLACGLSIPPEIPACGINAAGLIIVNEAFMKEPDEFKVIGILHELEHINLKHHENMDDNAAKKFGKVGKNYIQADIEADHAVGEKVGKEVVIDWLKYYCAIMDSFMASKYNFPENENEPFKQRIEALEAS